MLFPIYQDEELIQRVSALLSESSSDSGCGASERSDTPEPKVSTKRSNKLIFLTERLGIVR